MALFAVSSILALGVLWANGIGAVDVDSVKDQGCFAIEKTMPVDIPWIMSQKKIYTPLISRACLYKTLGDVLKDAMEDKSEADVYYDSCMTMGISPKGAYVVNAFGGSFTGEVLSRPLDPGMERFEFGPESGEGYSGSCSVTLTDNKTFIFYACCTNRDKQMIWATLATQPTLPKDTVSKIHEHALSLGFKKEFFTGLRYNSCGKSKNKEEL